MNRTLPSALLQKLLTLVPLTATGTEVYVATTNTVIYGYYDSLVSTLNHMKSIKLKYHTAETVVDLCDTILLDAERLESSVAFNHKHPGYDIGVFDDTSGSRFHIWVTHKYKEVMEFIKKLCVCD